MPLPAIGDRIAPDQVCCDFLSIVEQVPYLHDMVRMLQDPDGIADVRVHTERWQLDGHHSVAARFQGAR